MSDGEPVDVAFVCVQNAGRSQMAAAFAERERERRGLDGRIRVHTGGTRPADSVHDGVVDAMAEAGFDLSDRTPREVATGTLEACDYVATMGCSTLSLPARVDVRDWALDDPDGKDPERVREIRDEVETKVRALFDEVEADLERDVDGVEADPTDGADGVGTDSEDGEPSDRRSGQSGER